MHHQQFPVHLRVLLVIVVPCGRATARALPVSVLRQAPKQVSRRLGSSLLKQAGVAGIHKRGGSGMPCQIQATGGKAGRADRQQLPRLELNRCAAYLVVKRKGRSPCRVRPHQLLDLRQPEPQNRAVFAPLRQMIGDQLTRLTMGAKTASPPSAGVSAICTCGSQQPFTRCC